jgi:Mg2+ and Co2+ transporter CorA
VAGARPEWIDLIDPTAEELRKHLPASIHATALQALVAPHVHDDEPRPRIESHDDYILGIFLLPVSVPDEDRVYYQEIDFVATEEALVSVSKTPPGEEPFDPKPAKDACRELEDMVAGESTVKVGKRLRELRQDIRGIRRTLAPTRDAVHKIVDNRVELEDGELFPRDVEIAFGSAYDKFLRSSESLDASRDALAGVRDYLQGKISNDQNEVMKRLTLIASLLLVPTFIVGLYGQNFVNIPELHWMWGYWWSWGWIIGTTIVQLVFFRWKRWI